MQIYVTGHKNPDMDSICSAIGYANLKNLIEPGNTYIPVTSSHVGDENKSVLRALGIPLPEHLKDVYPKVKDVMVRSEVCLDTEDSLEKYADIMIDYIRTQTGKKGLAHLENATASDVIPVVPVFEGGRFYGLLSSDEVALWVMKNMAVSGTLTQAPKVRDLLDGTPSLSLSPEDLYEDGKSLIQNTGSRGIPVLTDGKYAGHIIRSCFLDTPKYNVILVDHNETSQSVKGIETANVLEIIDHHRLNAMKTSMPLFIDAEPLGSTCTIVYQLFLRNGIRPDNATAKTLLTGLLSDTVILKSPTTTHVDIESAAMLSAICRTTAEEYGRQMFDIMEQFQPKDPLVAIKSDYKLYNEKRLSFGIGQMEVSNLHVPDAQMDTYLAALEQVRSAEGVDWAMLMVTDVVKEQSLLLCTEFSAEKNLSFRKIRDHVYDMPGVLSRKKQLLPEILHTIGAD